MKTIYIYNCLYKFKCLTVYCNMGIYRKSKTGIRTDFHNL